MTSILTRRRKAVSPVIATVILIAVAVALGIAVAFWASGLTSSFSKYEKLGVNTQYATGSQSTGWLVHLGGQNTGSSDATITSIEINGVPYPISSSVKQNCDPSNTPCVSWFSASGSGDTNTSYVTAASLSVPSGDSFTIVLSLGSSVFSSQTFTDGQTIQATIITAAGNNYPASIVLP